MPQLPESLDLAQVGAPTTPEVAVAPTSFGLDQASATLGNVASNEERNQRYLLPAQRRADALAAAPAAGAAAGEKQALTETWLKGAGDVKPGDDGFVSALNDKLTDIDAKAIQADPDMPAGVRVQLGNQLSTHSQQLVNAATLGHANALAQPLLEAQASQDIAAKGQGLAVYTARIGAAQSALQNDYLPVDPSDPNAQQTISQHIAAVGAAADQATSAALAAVPADVRPQLQVELATQKAAALAGAADFAVKANTGKLIAAYKSTIDTFTDGVLKNPANYQSTLSAIDAWTATLPPGLQKSGRDDARAQAADARLDTLTRTGHASAAYDEIKSGQYDGVLQPKEIEQWGAKAQAAALAAEPTTADQVAAQQAMEQSAGAAIATLQATGQLPRGAPVAKAYFDAMGRAKGEAYQAGLTLAAQQAAAEGPVRGLSNADLAVAARAPPPNLNDPNYPAQYVAWKGRVAAAAAELEARSDPAQRIFSSPRAASPAAIAQTGAAPGSTVGQVISAAYDNFTKNPAAGGATFANFAIGSQAGLGFSPDQMRLIPAPAAKALAASLGVSDPGERTEALQSLSALINGLPANLRLSSGAMVSPRAMMVRQLSDEGLKGADIAAVADLGANPAAMGRYVAALTNPETKKQAEGKQGLQLDAQVRTALGPYIQASAAMPGAADLTQARIDRTAFVARGLMAGGASMSDAVKAAAADVTGNYVVDGTVMVPKTAVPAHGGVGVSPDPGPFGGLQVTDGLGMLRLGRQKILYALGQNNAANIAPAGGVATGQADAQKTAFLATLRHGQWTTTPDGGGAVLQIPNGTSGAWTPVTDIHGRPITATWAEQEAIASGHAQPGFLTPPPAALKAPNGQVVGAPTRQTAFNALAAGIVNTESHGVNGQKSGEGALGTWQTLPQIVTQYAPRLGLPVDLHRAQFDPAYSEKIGRAYLADLVNHFGTSPGALMLAAAAYHDGQGNVDKVLIPRFGDPRDGSVDPDAWLNQVEGLHPKTGHYVRQVLPVATGFLQRGH